MKAYAGQLLAELHMTLHRGETVLLTLGIPVAFLTFFSKVHVIPTPTHPSINFYVPGILALAIMSTSMVSLGIATGFERGYGVLKRLGATPLGRPRLIAAKLTAVALIELLQVLVLFSVGEFSGWHRLGDAHIGAAAIDTVAITILATAAFGGIGLLMAGLLRAEMNLAAANGFYVVLLLVGGMVVPLSKLPHGLAAVSRVLPAGALSDALHAALVVPAAASPAVPSEAWLVLGIWAVLAPLAAAFTFRWE